MRKEKLKRIDDFLYFNKETLRSLNDDSENSGDQHFLLIKYYDITVLMARKMIACIERVYEKGDTGISMKGRDFFDLLWYMQKEVNGERLYPSEQRLKDFDYSSVDAFEALDNKVKKIKSRDLLVDLEPFFANNVFIRDWCDNFHDLYSRYRKFYANK